MKKNSALKYFASPKVLISIILGMTLIIVAMMVAVVGMNDNGLDTAEVSSQPSVSSTHSATSSTDSTSSSGVVSSAISSSSSTSSVVSEYVVPDIKGLPVADDDPFGNITPNSGSELVCYLTFDDGPCANTDKILKILNENDVKATFFVVASMSIKKVTDIYNAGHAIGLHTGNHELNELYANPTAFVNDLKRVSDEVYKRTGIRSNLTRFPGGSATAKAKLGESDFETVKELLSENGYTYFDWNIDSGDTHKKSPTKSYVMQEIRDGLYKSNGELKSNVCILMHDIKGVTVEALPDIIKELKALGYTFETLDANAPTYSFY